MTQHTRTLQEILTRFAANQSSGLKSLAVFDLDSTLFDVGPRLEKILMDFAEVEEHRRLFPEQIRFFSKIKVERRDWGVKDALLRAGLDGHHPDFQKTMRDFWRTHFFSNEYLEHDVPYAGAVDYVRALADRGAEIVYLTGRDVQRMGEGSAAVLRKWDFPLGEGAHLVLKPQKEMDDAAFKTDWFLALKEDAYPGGIWFFENEPVNINLMRLRAKHVGIVFFDSTHSRREEAPVDLPRIVDFLLELDDSGGRAKKD